MSGIAVGITGLGILVAVVMMGMPIAVSLGLVGFLGIWYLSGLQVGLEMLGAVPFLRVADWTLIALPLFVLMGNFAAHTGISRNAFDTGHKWLGHLPGGLGLATVFSCGLFASVCGSSLAEAAIMGKVVLPEMNRHGYNKEFSAGCVAAGGTFGILIPPSIILIIYGTLTEQSIGQLFMAGFMPGILVMCGYFVAILILTRLKPDINPPVEKAPFKEMLRSARGLSGVVILFLIVVIGIYTGLFTPTEAAGIGAFSAFIMALVTRNLSWRTLGNSLLDAGRFSAMVFLIVIGAILFMYFLAMSGVPTAMAELAIGSAMPPLAIIAFILLVYILLGCIIDTLGMILLTVPIFFPVILHLGFNPIWFGVIVAHVAEIALITPPIGINVFVIKGVAEDVSMAGIFRGIIPFLISDLVVTVFLVLFPQISLWLPSTMF